MRAAISRDASDTGKSMNPSPWLGASTGAAAAAVPTAAGAAAVAASARAGWVYPATSAAVTRPRGPVGGMARTSKLLSRAMARASGEAKTRPAESSPTRGAGGAAAAGTTGTGAAAAAGAGGAGALAGADTGAGEGAGADSAAVYSANAATRAASSSVSSTIITTGVPTLISWPACTRILATTPGSWASNPIVALSVSISAMTSPAPKLSPSFTFHDAIVPASMVGERAGRPMIS
mmetsp:Transcript_64907/g.130484  ORF Transcript_64907/g.130484 Transcript_64907/m.130484 type:complete len:235 (+) Transcript_64907:927-1631(+)